MGIASASAMACRRATACSPTWCVATVGSAAVCTPRAAGFVGQPIMDYYESTGRWQASLAVRRRRGLRQLVTAADARQARRCPQLRHLLSPPNAILLLLCLRRCAPAGARCARTGLAVLLCSPPDTLTSIGRGVKSSGPERRCAGHAGWRSRAGDRCRIVCLSVCLSGLCVTCLRPLSEAGLRPSWRCMG